MDLIEINEKYKVIKERFNEEVRALNQEYIASNSPFKVGDVVKYKVCGAPKLVQIAAIHFSITRFENHYGKAPNVLVTGLEIDEEGYLIPFTKGGTQICEDSFRVENIIEITNIKSKGRTRYE